MQQNELIPHLFRTEYRKIISVLVKLFGIEHIEVAEDIVSDTFLQAAESWGKKGVPENPTAWLYTVSKNKTKDLLKHNTVFNKKVAVEIKHTANSSHEIEIDLSNKNINDSQLQMIFAVCHPSIAVESQIGLALNILCGFGAEEIADAFLSNRETIYKRLQRAKEKLKTEKINIELPVESEINNRLDTVLTTMYLLFNEGYYSASQNVTLRKDLCLGAMRLTLLLSENEGTKMPQVNALLSLMCFHASRFEARTDKKGEIILYEDQDENLWSRELIEQGEFHLNKASVGNKLSNYHLEAAIAFWHTNKSDTKEKWENILQLYNKLLVIEYSPIAALNRTYALSKANSNDEAITEAEKLALKDDHLYHSLLAELYKQKDLKKAYEHLKKAYDLAKTSSDKTLISKKIKLIEEKKN